MDATNERQVRRLDRKPLSCVSCRAKKLRCDREIPTCGNCRCRPEVRECVYPISNRGRWRKSHNISDGTPTGGIDLTAKSASNGPQEYLQAKVDRLEQTIQQLTRMNGSRLDLVNHSPRHALTASDTSEGQGRLRSPADTPLGAVTASMGAVTTSPATSSEAGEALWVSLLSEIKKMDDKEPPTHRGMIPTSLFASRAVPLAEILLHLPSRFTCDKIVTTYFSSREPTSCILHQPTFLEQYETFWQNQDEASIIWVAVLLGILRIVVCAWARDRTEPDELQGKCHDLETSYRQRASECLSHVDYAHPQPFLLEALLLHLYVLYSANRDFHSSLWVQHGLAVRLSIRLGYHIDPVNLRDISPFQAEMRKRIWSFIRQADVLFSFQIGLPSMLDHRWLNGGLPGNFDDTDISHMMDALPDPRTNTDITSVSYLISKSKLVFGFARALDALSRNEIIPYDRVLEFDNEIRGIYRSIPSQYQVNDMEVEDTQNALDTGLGLVLGAIYHKALCIIHSRFLKSAITDQQYLYSWLVCINSAMTMLTYQSFLHQNPRAEYQNIRLHRYQHSLTTHDFFLAATMLCTALFLLKRSSISVPPMCASLGPSRDDMMAALANSISIFDRLRKGSLEAHQAGGRLTALLKELRGDSEHNLETAYRRPGIIDREQHMAPGSDLNSAFSKSISSIARRRTSFQLSGNCGMSHDLNSELADWDPASLGLDLDDPLAFVQDFQNQDSFFV